MFKVLIISCFILAISAWPYSRSYGDYDYPQSSGYNTGGYARPSGGYGRPSYIRPDQFQIHPENMGYPSSSSGYARPSGGYGRPTNMNYDQSGSYQGQEGNTGIPQNPSFNNGNWDAQHPNPTTFGERFGSQDSQWSAQNPVSVNPSGKTVEGVVTMNGPGNTNNGPTISDNIDTTGVNTFGTSSASGPAPDVDTTQTESTDTGASSSDSNTPSENFSTESEQPSNQGEEQPSNQDQGSEQPSEEPSGQEEGSNSGSGLFGGAPAGSGSGLEVSNTNSESPTINPSQTADGALVLG